VQHQSQNLNNLPRAIFELYLPLQILSTFTVYVIPYFSDGTRGVHPVPFIFLTIYCNCYARREPKIGRISCTLPLLGKHDAKSIYKLYLVRLAITSVNLLFLIFRQGCTIFFSVLENSYVTSSKQTENIGLMKLSFV